MIRFLRDFNARRRKRAAARLRQRTAHEFNVRNTLIAPWNLRDGRWMCPQCLKVHTATEWSFLTGAQYPACCLSPAGHRVYV